MSGRADSDTHPEQTESAGDTEHDDNDGHDNDGHDNDDHDEAVQAARRARWISTGTGAVLAVAGLAAALLRLTGDAPPLVPAAYACGAAVCALAGLLGSRGRTRRALWLLIAGLMVMALGDQFD
ncbi:hypothetical protein [Streptomyces sp. NPDC052012]|uniref:hypothetical protein n=1 Tax=Streptomyces sp. NPDC052012 TaxID=3155051 RepID=UPI00344EACB1